MSIRVTNELEWHNGKDIPEPTTGSFLILTKNGGIAEAEYRNNRWFQYRWSIEYLSYKDVIAWCRLSDIIPPEE